MLTFSFLRPIKTPLALAVLGLITAFACLPPYKAWAETKPENQLDQLMLAMAAPIADTQTLAGLQFRTGGRTVSGKTGSYLASLSPELLKHYELVLFVNKSTSGPMAQNVAWLKPSDNQDRSKPWVVDRVWKVSTGREQHERYKAAGSEVAISVYSTTPAGVYNLHPTRQFQNYESNFYNGAAMPYSVFLDHRTTRSEGYGIAFHAAPSGAHYRLGSRASGGCIRLAYDNARTLFTTLRSDYRGAVPMMEMAASGEWNKYGRMALDERGLPIMVNGLKALVVIEETKNLNY